MNFARFSRKNIHADSMHGAGVTLSGDAQKEGAAEEKPGGIL